jgi:hypothetical protein
MPSRGHIAACTLDADSLRWLRRDCPPQQLGTEEILQELAAGLEGVGPIRLAYLGKGRVGLNLAKLEGGLAFSGVTLNSPYMHPGMAAVAHRIPDELSRPGRATKSKATGKYAFMQMIERKRLLPDEITYQPKRSPVTSPVDHWYWGSLREFMLERISCLPFDVNHDYVQSLVTPTLAERAFRARVGISRYVTSAICLLVTYAAFAEVAASPRMRS